MKNLVDWATNRARMILVFIIMSLGVGILAYVNIPKEGEPDIDIPVLFVSVPFPGISAEDSEKLLVKPMESKLKGIDGLKTISGKAAEGYGAVILEFEFGWDKKAIIADVRDKVNQVQSSFPDGAKQASITEINLSQFPILIISLSGKLPERTMLKVATNLQDKIEAMPGVLEASLSGYREEMLEVLIDPLKLEAYNVTAGELIRVVNNNNLLIAAGELETKTGAFSFKIPSSFNDAQDVYSLPVKVNGGRVITLGDLADIRLTFEDRRSTARFNGNATVALQIVKRKGVNLIDTVLNVKNEVKKIQSEWPAELQKSISVNYSSDQSIQVSDMVSQLESSVFTAIALVMIVILATLGIRSAFLVGFAIPTSFLLAFAIMGVTGITISNIVMFGLILAVGMLVDGAIVVVEYADKKISAGMGPMKAYAASSKRMFWPIISSTATTLCAFLPMLFWPGIPGQFMAMLPITMIYVLSSSLLVALIYLPVVGGIAGRFSRFLERISDILRQKYQRYILFISVGVIALLLFIALMLMGRVSFVLGAIIFLPSCISLTTICAALRQKPLEQKVSSGYKRNWFGTIIHFIVGNPIMPFISIILTIIFVATVFSVFGKYNKGVEFFVETEPENAIIYVRARGNLSLIEKDNFVRQVEDLIYDVDGIKSLFTFAGSGGLNNNTRGAGSPRDTIGQIQVELTQWHTRLAGPTGKEIINEIDTRIANIPGIKAEILLLEQGPPTGKALSIRVKGQDWDNLITAVKTIRTHFEETKTAIQIEDTLPLPGIDWQVNVDIEKAGRYQADVAQVGAMVQLITRGLLLGTMRVDSSDDEIDIKVRLPEKDRLVSTLETLRIRTSSGLIPISNFITLEPVRKLGEIDRTDSKRYFDIKANIIEGVNANKQIAKITKWLEAEPRLPDGIEWEWKGDQGDQNDSIAFLSKAFIGALGLMFIILLAQFNSVYNSILVLISVILSTTGVLIGMLVMGQTFSIIMTGTGIVALAGIVVNNNIVLIDTFQEYSAYMPKIQAIVRTAEDRIRPVVLTTLTTMAGLAPMMFGISIDFNNGGYSIDSPMALWWKQLATAVVFGLGVATVLTLIVTPSLLALRIWVNIGIRKLITLLWVKKNGKNSRNATDFALQKQAKNTQLKNIYWDETHHQ